MTSTQCRTCIAVHESTNFHKLTEQMDPENYPEKSLADTLWDLAKIDIKNENARKLPQKICENCLRALKNAYSFVVQAQRVNQCLLSTLQTENQSKSNLTDCLTELPIDIPANSLEIKVEVGEESIYDSFNTSSSNGYISRKRQRTDSEQETNILGSHAEVCAEQETMHEDKSDIVKLDPIVTLEPGLQLDEDHNFENIGFEDCCSNSERGKHNPARGAVSGNFSTSHSCSQDRNYHDCEVMAKLNFMMQEIHNISNNVNRLLETKHGPELGSVEFTQRFPLKNGHELKELETVLDDDNFMLYVNGLKPIVRENTVTKTLSEIFSEKLILQYNVEGRNNKLALNSYPKTLQMLYRAHEQYKTYGEFATDLRVAFKRCKNRYAKAKQREKQSSHEMILTPDIPE